MLKGAFIGFGRMGITHFSILNSHPDVSLVAVADRSGTMMKVLGNYTGVRTYTDHQKMLDSEELDFVVISTPSSSHGSIIADALARDLHIFVEKPFTLTAEEGRGVLAQLGEKKLVNQVGYVNRFNDIFVDVKRLLDSGLIGDIRSYSAEMYGATVLKDSGSSWRSKKQEGGGCMYEFASHCIDLSVYLFGAPARVAGSSMESVYSSTVEDIVTTMFHHDGGYCGRINVNWSDDSYRKPTNLMTIFGTRGSILADKHSYRVYLRDADEAAGFGQGWSTRYIADITKSVRFYVRGNEFTAQLDHFVDCINGKVSDNRSSFSAGYLTDVLMEQIRADAALVSAAPKIDYAGNASVPAAPPRQRSFWDRLRGKLRLSSNA